MSTPEGLRDPAWAEDQLALRATIRDWILRTIERNQGCPWRGIHDEANFTVSFCDYYLFTGDERVRTFLRALRDSYLEWAKEHYFHGFVPTAKDYVTHTFELADGFISAMARMEPEDPVNKAFIEDVAHHIGNWVPEVPAWYDWNRHMFVSHWVGTKEVRNYPPYDFATVRHARVGNLALTTYAITGDKKYLDWCRDFAGGWAEVILACKDRIPMARYHTPVEQWPPCPERHRNDYGDPYQGTRWARECQQVITFLLKLHAVSPEPRLLQAADKAIQLIEAATGTDSVIGLMTRYEAAAGTGKYRQRIQAYYRNQLLPRLEANTPMPTIVFLEEGKDTKTFAYRDAAGRIVEYNGPSVSDYLAGWRLTGNLNFLRRAMAQADQELRLVAKAFRDGRDHGCAGGQYAHGEGGRAAGALYGPAGRNLVRYFRENGRLGLEEGIAVVLDPTSTKNEPILWFYNATDKTKRVRIAPEERKNQIVKASLEEKPLKEVAEGYATVTLEPKQVVRLTVTFASK